MDKREKVRYKIFKDCQEGVQTYGSENYVNPVISVVSCSRRINLLQWLNLFEKEYFPKHFNNEYHNHNLDQLLEVIKKNRNKISIDPSDRKIQELLEKQFAKSISILEPLKAGIKATDELIDEEIKVVKGAVS